MSANGSGDFDIGFNDSPDAAVKLAMAAILGTSVNDALNALQVVKTTALEPVDEAVNESFSVLSECRSCVDGALQSKIDDIGKVIDSVFGAIAKRIDYAVEDVNSRVIALYQEYPSPWIDETQENVQPAEQIEYQDLTTFYNDLAQFSSQLREQVQLQQPPSTTPDDPPLPRCPNGIVADCPSTAYWELVNGVWQCTSSLNGKPVDPLCIEIGPGGGGGGGTAWKCVDGKCVEDKAGEYATLEECKAACESGGGGGGGGGPWECVDNEGNSIGCYGDTGIYETVGKCTNEKSGESFDIICYHPCVVPIPDCAGIITFSCNVNNVNCPDPPDPPPPPPEAKAICDLAFLPGASKSAISKAFDSSIYLSLPATPTAVSLVAVKINCLKDGTAQILCNNKLLAELPSDYLSYPIGKNTTSWTVDQYVDDDGVVRWYHYNEEYGAEMRLKGPAEFYFLQFGKPSDHCDEVTTTSKIAPNPTTLDVGTDYCDPAFANGDMSTWKNIDDWGASSLEDIDKNVKKSFEESVAKDDSWFNYGVQYVVGSLKSFVMLLLLGPIKIANAMVTNIGLPTNCDIKAMGPLTIYNWFVNNIPIISNVFPGVIKATVSYLSNYKCQYLIPGPGEINTLYSQNHLNDAEWEMGQRMHGNCIPWQKRIVEAMEKDFSAAECVALYNAGKFTDEDFRLAMNEIQWKGEEMLDKVKYLGKVVPTVGELFEGMTRDVNNPAIINALKLNDLLDERNVGDTKDWIDRHGMTDEVLRYKWRLHWKLIDQRVVLRLYVAGQIDLEDMYKIYQYNGHPPQVAEDLARAVQSQYWDKRAASSGRKPFRLVKADYMAGKIDEETFYLTLQSMGAPADKIQNIIDTADSEWNYAEFQRLWKSARRAFLRGTFDSDQYMLRLHSIGMDDFTAEQIVINDTNVKNESNKPILMAELCKLVSQGHISIAEYQQRAVNLGYDPYDASLKVASCVTEIQEKMKKEFESEQRANIQAQEKAKREREKEQRRIEAEQRKQRVLFKRHMQVRQGKLPQSSNILPIPDGYGGVGTN